jgi:hypothetical protein
MVLKRLGLLQLLLEDALECDGISSELGDTLPELLNSHLLLVEVEAERGLIVDVCTLGDVQAGGRGSIQLLGHLVGGVVEILEEVGGDGQVVATSELCNLTDVAEGSTHDDGLVAVLLVVVEDGLNALDTRVFSGSKVLLHGGLVPIENAADEGRDEESASLGGSDGLNQGEHEGQVAVDAFLLENLCSLDTFPCGGDLDQNTRLVDANLLVELKRSLARYQQSEILTYVDNVVGLVDGALGVKAEGSIDFC